MAWEGIWEGANEDAHCRCARTLGSRKEISCGWMRGLQEVCRDGVAGRAMSICKCHQAAKITHHIQGHNASLHRQNYNQICSQLQFQLRRGRGGKSTGAGGMTMQIRRMPAAFSGPSPAPSAVLLPVLWAALYPHWPCLLPHHLFVGDSGLFHTGGKTTGRNCLPRKLWVKVGVVASSLWRPHPSTRGGAK